MEPSDGPVAGIMGFHGHARTATAEAPTEGRKIWEEVGQRPYASFRGQEASRGTPLRCHARGTLCCCLYEVACSGPITEEIIV